MVLSQIVIVCMCAWLSASAPLEIQTMRTPPGPTRNSPRARPRLQHSRQPQRLEVLDFVHRLRMLLFNFPLLSTWKSKQWRAFHLIRPTL